MKIFKNLFSKKSTSTSRLEDMIENVDISIDTTTEYLYFIQEMLLKLELINNLFDKNKSLTDKISFYREKLQILRDTYEVRDSCDNTNFADMHNKSINYKVALSMLIDEVNETSQPYFYLDSLDSFLHQDIDASNIEEKKDELLELESKIQMYSKSDNLLEKKLYEKLVEVIWYLLTQEVKLTKDWDFYMELSRNSQLLIQRKFLVELLKRLNKDSYIKEYVKENNIESLAFDYEMFSYMLMTKKESKEFIEKFHKKISPDFHFDFLTKKEVLGSSRLSIFKKRGIIAEITDFAIALGSYVENLDLSDENIECDLNDLSFRAGNYWLSGISANYGFHINAGGYSYSCELSESHGFRPIVPFSEIENICSCKKRCKDGVLIVEFGEYPQMAAFSDLQNELENLFNKSQSNFKQDEVLHETGKTYSLKLKREDPNLSKYSNSTFIEYEYKGKKYVRVKFKFYRSDDYFSGDGPVYLSNYVKYSEGDYVWIEVQPIEWLVDEKENIAVAKKILFSKEYSLRENCCFEETTAKLFLDNGFAKDIIPSKSHIKNDEDTVGTSSTLAIEQKEFLDSLNSDQLVVLESILSGNQVVVSNYLNGLSDQSSKVKQY